jgi:hypothetical protein
MPHVILKGSMDFSSAATTEIQTGPHRWGRAVLKTERWWTRSDAQGLLVEGVIVEFSRALHPLALVAPHHGDTAIRLWPYLEIEKTRPLQRWLALIAGNLQSIGAGVLKTTNIPDDILDGVDLR